MQLFFVFNTTFCKLDEDDPKDAVLYFYPAEICDAQRYELCFQLVGVSQFLKSTFTSPLVVSLNQGKFAFFQSQNYLLVLGGNNAMNSTILKEQLQHLYRTFAFYLKDINSVSNICGSNRSRFLQKIKEMWDQILLTSKFFRNETDADSSILPMTTFSQKNSSDIRSRAKQLLHLCQRNPPVIAGAIFCEELLVYSQLTPELTRNLMLLVSSQDCAASRDALVPYKLPPGVKMKNVYLTPKEISSVLKYNHMNVGSQFRYQTHKKLSISLCGATSLSSGSEGDVDSGNSSEGAGTQKSDTSVLSCSDSQSQSNTEHLLLCNSDALDVYSPYSNCSQHLSRTVDKNLERHISTDTERSCSTAYESAPGNIFDHCRRHSQYFDTTNGSSWKHTVLKRCHSFSCTFNSKSNNAPFDKKRTCCDSELCLRTNAFRTSGCTERYNLPISEKWDFENLTHLTRRTMQTGCNLHTISCYFCLIKRHSLATEFLHNGAGKKLQVLKCRLNKRRNKNYSHSKRASGCSTNVNSPVVHVSTTVVPSVKKNNSTVVVENLKNCNLINSSERQEMFLYVQRYCDCTLFLLLNSSFDEDLLNDLWMHGFSHLGEIELEAKKFMSVKSAKRNDFQICVLDSVQDELLDKPPCMPPNIEDRINDTIMQMMHIDLQSNASLRSVSLISQNRSVVGYSAPPNEIYYIQPGTVNLSSEMYMHREPFTSLYRKAQHRIKRHSGVSVAES